ncbi:TPA: DUF1642 domain-containing protein [Streptococcus suis]|nr:DUF1642 domain-containing protein [Streptococcus suis]
MNKQEAMKRIEQMGGYEPFVDEPISKKSVLNIISQIHEPQKVVVPQVAVEYYYEYKDCGYSLGELLSDFYSESAREEFPRLDELATWLHDNDEDTNRQRELALATLIVNGPDAVEVEKEQLYRVEFPTGQQLYKNHPNGSSKVAIVIKFANPKDKDGHFIKRELEEAGFGWVFDCSGVKVVEVE